MFIKNNAKPKMVNKHNNNFNCEKKLKNCWRVPSNVRAYNYLR